MMELPSNSPSGSVTVFIRQPQKPKRTIAGHFAGGGARSFASTRESASDYEHGSLASPWTYFGLARTLLTAGLTVALPEHPADNYKLKVDGHHVPAHHNVALVIFSHAFGPHRIGDGGVVTRYEMAKH
jgi:hypothetical protein